MKERAKHLTLASIAISIVLLVYVGFLLITNYTSQVGFKKSLIERFMIENERLAGSLGSFLNSRRDDLANLASSRAIEVYFENRAPARGGGAGPGLSDIKQKILALMDRYRFGADQPYDRIALIDDAGTVLVDVRSSPDSPPLAGGKALREPGHRTSTIVVKEGGREILVSAAFFQRGRYAGQLVAWLRTKFLFDYVLTHLPGSQNLTYLMVGTDVISVPGLRGALPMPPLEKADTAVEFDGPWRDGAPHRLIALRTIVVNSPFAVVTVAPAREVYGDLKPRGLLVSTFALAVVIIGSAIFVVRLNTRSQVLAARLEDSITHEQEVTKKNRQLEVEIAERRMAVEMLRRSEERYRMLIETSPDIIYTVAAKDGTIESLNPAFERVTGWPREKWIGRSFCDMVHPDDQELSVRTFEEVLRGVPRLRYELRCLTASGEYRTAEFTSTPLVHDGAVLGEFGIARDITERRKLEDQLRHAQKMEAVGQLAGGVAHDFNNMLSVIIGYCTILLEDLAEDNPLRQYVNLIFTSAERASQLTQNLLTFSRKQVLKTAVFDMNAIVGTVEPLLSRLIGETITMRLALARGPLPVMGDSVQIEQVLMNLVSNARDAMPQGGRLTIATGSVVINEAFRRGRGFGKPGPYAVLRVGDTGVGMDDATRERIFEPFFTTKEVGKGTGLGLSIVFGIVKQHYGYVEVESVVGEGTAFSVYLPLLARTEAPAIVQTALVPVRGGTETILLAEDNDEVRDMLTRVLQGAGYTVIQARDGRDAVSVFSANGGRIGLLVSDVIMPDMNGKEAFDEIRAIKPDVKALFVSGYAADILEQSGLTGRDAVFLQKPVIPSVLLSTIRDMLDQK